MVQLADWGPSVTKVPLAPAAPPRLVEVEGGMGVAKSAVHDRRPPGWLRAGRPEPSAFGQPPAQICAGNPRLTAASRATSPSPPRAGYQGGLGLAGPAERHAGERSKGGAAAAAPSTRAPRGGPRASRLRDGQASARAAGNLSQDGTGPRGGDRTPPRRPLCGPARGPTAGASARGAGARRGS